MPAAKKVASGASAALGAPALLQRRLRASILPPARARRCPSGAQIRALAVAAPSRARAPHARPLPHSPRPRLPCPRLPASKPAPAAAAPAASSSKAASGKKSAQKSAQKGDSAAADMEIALELVAALRENPGHSILLVPQEFMCVVALQRAPRCARATLCSRSPPRPTDTLQRGH